MASYRLSHFSYHKCLTVYFSKVMRTLYDRLFPGTGGYRHFKSLAEEFYEHRLEHRVASVNNQQIQIEAFDERDRISHFVRDPRDLVVSGYLYHKAGIEAWTRMHAPSPEAWAVVNGCVPDGMAPGQSLSSYLEEASTDDGLIAEIQFRGRQFEAMANQPTSDTRILTLRYEDVVGHEARAFRKILHHYRVGSLQTAAGVITARRYSAARSASGHIRDPRPAQHLEWFSPSVADYFMDRYRDLLALYEYEF